jgi:hypothetical protein
MMSSFELDISSSPLSYPLPELEKPSMRFCKALRGVLIVIAAVVSPVHSDVGAAPASKVDPELVASLSDDDPVVLMMVRDMKLDASVVKTRLVLQARLGGIHNQLQTVLGPRMLNSRINWDTQELEVTVSTSEPDAALIVGAGARPIVVDAGQAARLQEAFSALNTLAPPDGLNAHIDWESMA